MKKFLVMSILFLVFVGTVFAGVWTDEKKFKEYVTTKSIAAEADSAGNTIVSVIKYKEAAILASTYATAEIEAWQLNNAAYSLIKVFKDTKEKSLLVEAMTLLTDAKALNVESTLGKIQSNMDFCLVWLEVK